MTPEDFFRKGWCRFDFDSLLARWVENVLPRAREVVRAEDNALWLRCGGTWFAGVNVLPNDGSARLGDSGALRGKAVNFVHQTLGLKGFEWDRGQLSVCYPQYPRPMASESAGAFRYRRMRDAAHVDGLLPEGLERRRHLREHHGFILGIPMVDFSPDASPFVVWEGSHEIMRGAFAERLGNLPPDRWGDEDITDAYHQARRKVFGICRRSEIVARPGESFVVHRLALHGVAPWAETAVAGDDGRMICYFRPEVGSRSDWLYAP